MERSLSISSHRQVVSLPYITRLGHAAHEAADRLDMVCQRLGRSHEPRASLAESGAMLRLCAEELLAYAGGDGVDLLRSIACTLRLEEEDIQYRRDGLAPETSVGLDHVAGMVRMLATALEQVRVVLYPVAAMPTAAQTREVAA